MEMQTLQEAALQTIQILKPLAALGQASVSKPDPKFMLMYLGAAPLHKSETFDVAHCFGINQYHTLRTNASVSFAAVTSQHLRVTDFEAACYDEDELQFQ